jgi:hypothetical protein
MTDLNQLIGPAQKVGEAIAKVPEYTANYLPGASYVTNPQTLYDLKNILMNLIPSTPATQAPAPVPASEASPTGPPAAAPPEPWKKPERLSYLAPQQRPYNEIV